MSPDSLAYTAHVAKKFAALALTIDPLYPSYKDSDNCEHYVHGPAIEQVTVLGEELMREIHELLNGNEPVMPDINVDVVNENLGWLL